MPVPSKRSRAKRRAHRLAWRLVDFLVAHPEWRVRFMRLQKDVRARVSLGFESHEIFVGATIPDRTLIALDTDYADTLGVFIHECLHAMWPDASEAKVLSHEDLVRRHLTPRQARAFVFLLGDRLR